MKYIVGLIVVVSLFTVFLPHTYATQTELNQDCKDKIEYERGKFQEKVMADVFETYDFPIGDEEKMISYDIHDLRKLSILTGVKDPHLESVYQQFENVSLGQKQLYFFNEDFMNAYILYKDPQYNNVMIQLNRDDGTWSVKETKVKEGSKIDFTKTDCKDEHVINKGYKGLFRGLN